MQGLSLWLRGKAINKKYMEKKKTKQQTVKKPKPLKRKKGLTPCLSYEEIKSRTKKIRPEDYLPTKLSSR